MSRENEETPALLVSLIVSNGELLTELTLKYKGQTYNMNPLTGVGNPEAMKLEIKFTTPPPGNDVACVYYNGSDFSGETKREGTTERDITITQKSTQDAIITLLASPMILPHIQKLYKKKCQQVTSAPPAASTQATTEKAQANTSAFFGGENTTTSASSEDEAKAPFQHARTK